MKNYNQLRLRNSVSHVWLAIYPECTFFVCFRGWLKSLSLDRMLCESFGHVCIYEMYLCMYVCMSFFNCAAAQASLNMICIYVCMYVCPSSKVKLWFAVYDMYLCMYVCMSFFNCAAAQGSIILLLNNPAALNLCYQYVGIYVCIYAPLNCAAAQASLDWTLCT